MQGKRTATATAAQRTADHGDQKGEVNMTTPNTGELLVQQAQEAERLRLLILADECKTIEEFPRKAPRAAEQVKRRATPARHGPTLHTRHGQRVRRRPATAKA